MLHLIHANQAWLPGNQITSPMSVCHLLTIAAVAQHLSTRLPNRGLAPKFLVHGRGNGMAVAMPSTNLKATHLLGGRLSVHQKTNPLLLQRAMKTKIGEGHTRYEQIVAYERPAIHTSFLPRGSSRPSVGSRVTQ